MNEPIRVLDLYAGGGAVRKLLARAYPGRTIQYTVLDSHSPHPTHWASSEVVDRFDQIVVPKLFDVGKPDVFDAKLQRHLGDSRFHLIYAIMPYPRPLPPRNQGKSLAVLAKYLSPGGVLTHLALLKM